MCKRKIRLLQRLLVAAMLSAGPATGEERIDTPPARSAADAPAAPIDKRTPSARVVPLPSDEKKLDRYDELRLQQLQRDYPAGMERDFIRAQ